MGRVTWTAPACGLTALLLLATGCMPVDDAGGYDGGNAEGVDAAEADAGRMTNAAAPDSAEARARDDASEPQGTEADSDLDAEAEAQALDPADAGAAPEASADAAPEEAGDGTTPTRVPLLDADGVDGADATFRSTADAAADAAADAETGAPVADGSTDAGRPPQDAGTANDASASDDGGDATVGPAVDAAVDAAADAAADAGGDATLGPPVDAATGAGGDGSSTTTDAGPPTCGDKTSDPANCGSCGHSCLGGACVAGACQPFVVATYTTAGNGRAIAVDPHNVYFTTSNTGSLFSCAKTGCGTSPTLLSSTVLAPYSLVFDPAAGSLWLDEWAADAVDRFSPSGTLDTQITGQNEPTGLAFDSSYVYWGSSSSIVRGSKDGSSQATIAAGLPSSVNAVAVDPVSDTVFGALSGDSAAIVAAPRSGSGAWSYFAGTDTTPQGNPVAIVVQGSHVYWIDEGSSANSYQDGGLFTCPVTGCSQPQSLTPSPFAWGLALVADSTDLYFVHATATDVPVFRCARTGCGAQATVLATNQRLMPGQTLTQDDTAIYWIQSQNNVMGLAK
jgi:hypothetical protein